MKEKLNYIDYGSSIYFPETGFYFSSLEAYYEDLKDKEEIKKELKRVLLSNNNYRYTNRF